MKPPAFAIVVSRFNSEITGALRASCERTLRRRRPKAVIKVVEVPGGFEIPWAVNRLASTGRFDVVISLGCVLKGQTPQNDHISRSVFQHLHDISLSTGVPCVTGIITPKTWKQAVKRTRGDFDRGREAAEAAVEMARLRRELSEEHGKT